TGTVEDQDVTVSLGTSGTIFAFASKPVIDPNGNVASFCSSTGAWLPLMCTMNCGQVVDRFRELIVTAGRHSQDFAARTEPGAGGITILPFFSGERTPN